MFFAGFLWSTDEKEIAPLFPHLQAFISPRVNTQSFWEDNAGAYR